VKIGGKSPEPKGGRRDDSTDGQRNSPMPKKGKSLGGGGKSNPGKEYADGPLEKRAIYHSKKKACPSVHKDH